MPNSPKDDEFWVPKGVGPHEERELDMLLAGTKPLAMFSDEKAWGYDFGEEEFDKYVATGDLIKQAEVYDFPRMEIPMRCVYYARPEEAWRLAVIHALTAEVHSVGHETNLQISITGELLGYTDQEIDVFIGWVHRDK